MKRSYWVLLSVLISLVLVVVSCGTPASETTTTTTTTTPPVTTTTTPPVTTTTTTPPASEEPKYGGTLKFAYTLQPGSLDPAVGTSGGDAYYWQQIFDQLVAANPDLSPAPDRSLASSWEFPDPLTMIFYLRSGVSFQDGTAFDASAVKFNIDRILDANTRATPRSSFQAIASVEVVNTLTVKFNLARPWSAGMGLLPDRGGAMSSPTAIQKYGAQYGVNPVGTGPFKVSEYVAGSALTLVKNETYWGKDKNGKSLPYFDRLVEFIIPDPTVVDAALQTGKVDLCFINSPDIDKFSTDPTITKNIAITTFPGSGVAALMYFNQAKPPMDNLYLRKAIAYAIDWQAINQSVFYGKSLIADSGMWPPGTWVYDNTVTRPTYDVAKAKDFLKQGGMPAGFTIDMLTWGTNFTLAAQVVQAQLAEIGVTVNVKIFDVSTATNNVFTGGQAPLFLSSWSRYPEPDWIASNNYTSKATYNPGKLSDPEMDALVAQGAAEYDLAKRKEIYNQINQKILDQCFVIPGLYSVAYVGYWKEKVGGMENFFGWDAKAQLRYLWIK